MSTHHPAGNTGHQRGPTPQRPWPLRVGFWLLIGIAAFFLVTEHRAHLVTGLFWLPFLLLLACPLIHMFGHGHGGHAGHSSNRRGGGDRPPAPPADDRPAEAKADQPHTHGGDLP